MTLIKSRLKLQSHFEMPFILAKEILFNISTRSNTDYILDADYFEVDANFDSGNESIELTNFSVKDIIL